MTFLTLVYYFVDTETSEPSSSNLGSSNLGVIVKTQLPLDNPYTSKVQKFSTFTEVDEPILVTNAQKNVVTMYPYGDRTPIANWTDHGGTPNTFSLHALIFGQLKYSIERTKLKIY